MIVMKENERLYLTNWGYNAARILSDLAVIAANNGAIVNKPHKAIVSNRTLSSACRDLESKIEKALALNTEKATHAAKTYKEELEKLQAIDNAPIEVTHTTYINFVLEGYYYSYSVDDNPFFPFHVMKTPIDKNEIDADACMNESKKEWLYDCFFTFQATNADCKEAANMIYNEMMNSKPAHIRRDCKRQRVPNTYNNGYHYETVYSKRRTRKIDLTL